MRHVRTLGAVERADNQPRHKSQVYLISRTDLAYHRLTALIVHIFITVTTQSSIPSLIHRAACLACDPDRIICGLRP